MLCVLACAFWAFGEFMGNSGAVFGGFAVAIYINVLDEVCMEGVVHAPGPGVMVSGQSLGSLSFGLMVRFLRFSLS